MKIKLLQFIILMMLFTSAVFAEVKPAHYPLYTKALMILNHLSLKEKIGQKLMLDFRYWCSSEEAKNKACTQDFTAMNPAVRSIMIENHIGGVILFSNNLKTIPQITTLTHDFQQTMTVTNNLPLLIGTDQEGGIVARLPRNISATFPGNMATTAAYLGNPNSHDSIIAGKIFATDLKAVGINIDFAPDVDVNINPLNPIIHVRSFSDDPALVAKLGLDFTRSMQENGVAATLKHFPGHGDTTVDSHIGLPIVNHHAEEAWKIDLYPFKEIIKKNPPDLIMSAHIQFPALDDSTIYADKIGKAIMKPATLSRKIQHDLLRNQLNFTGVTITDALDMGAIATNFDPLEATIKAFRAGNDIALMPISVSQPNDLKKISEFIAKIEAAVRNGMLSEKEINESVLRILMLKIKLGLLNPDERRLAEKIQSAEKIFADESQRKLEKEITDHAITLVQNKGRVLPVKILPKTRIHILTPWLEQGAGMAAEITQLQQQGKLPKELQVSFAKMADTNLAIEKNAVDQADIIIVGNSTTKSLPLTATTALQATLFHTPTGTLVFPDMPTGDNVQDNKVNENNENLLRDRLQDMSEAQFAYQVLNYAKEKGKKTIFISLLAPYDLPNYSNVADVMLAGYNFYGYLEEENGHGYYRGPSMPALVRIIFGINNPIGKLPINIPNPSAPNELIYPRGFGLIFG